MMKRFIEGIGRDQVTMLPDCLDDYVEEDNPVRVIDTFIGMLDLGALGFGVEPEWTGRPGYGVQITDEDVQHATWRSGEGGRLFPHSG